MPEALIIVAIAGLVVLACVVAWVWAAKRRSSRARGPIAEGHGRTNEGPSLDSVGPSSRVHLSTFDQSHGNAADLTRVMEAETGSRREVARGPEDAVEVLDGSSTGTTINPRGAAVVQALVGLTDQLRDQHPNVDVELPSAVVGDDGTLLAIEVSLRPGTLTAEQLRNLPLAQRVEIVVEVGQYVQALHDRGWAWGATMAESIGYRRGDDRPVVIGGLASARPLGSLPAILPRPTSRRRSTERPTAEAPQLPTFDRDRRQYALLVHETLLGHSATPADVQAGSAVSLDPTQRRRLELLDARASGPPGSRPTVSEWLAALDSSRSRTLV